MDTLRYIITRACLQEGSLRLQRYLRPHFPAEGQVRLFDESGHEYQTEVSQGERLLGVGPFYRDHNLGVNDVVLITPLLPGCYKVEAIVKPYARPEPDRERSRAAHPSSTSPLGEPVQESSVRVVVHASAHVREVRVQSQSLGAPECRPWASMERETAERAERAERYVVPPLGRAASEGAGPGLEATSAAGVRQVHRGQVMSPSAAGEGLQAGGAALSPEVHAGTEEPTETRNRMADEPAHAGRVTVRPVRTPQAPQQETDLAAARHLGAAEVTARSEAVQARPPQEGLPLRQSGGTSASAASQRLLRDLATAPAEVRRASRLGGDSGQPSELLPSSGLEAAQPTGGMTRADGEQLLETLGRRYGYRVDYPAAGLTRLRAELGTHSHTVLVASGGSAMNSAEWRDTRGTGEAGTAYRLWLTSEAQATLDAPVITYQALHRLMEAQVQLSPQELRAVWEAGALDAQSATGLIRQEQKKHQEKAALASLLRVLAQQPAHSLVTSARLAEQLGDLEAAQLNRMLTLLSRSPVWLLTPLGNGQYLLRQEVSQFLGGVAQACQALSDEVSQPTEHSAKGAPSWTAEQILSAY